MNFLQSILDWFKTPADAQLTWGDRLIQAAGDYLKTKATEAQDKAHAANASAPADNAPGATTKKSEAPLGQTLFDVLRANGQA